MITGYKLSSLEIERELLSHPRIREVAVVGEDDIALGEKVVAIVALRPSKTQTVGDDDTVGGDSNTELLSVDAIRSFLANRLASYKHPRRVIVVESIPRNHMGKVNKKTIMSDITLITPVLKH